MNVLLADGWFSQQELPGVQIWNNKFSLSQLAQECPDIYRHMHLNVCV